ncbi:translation initiation factor IF-2 [Vigna unguiculata]|uniref:Translation initiation factor IF-2 n=1 Tax=Vigna unguiculata TaxID=3917 RepID=A0A4D6MTD9_VIGUN|nr:translation initiation factor IF-2 [Vigna unguiculata]
MPVRFVSGARGSETLNASSPPKEDKRAKVKVLQENIWSHNDVYVDEKPTKGAFVETMIVEQKSKLHNSCVLVSLCTTHCQTFGLKGMRGGILGLGGVGHMWEVAESLDYIINTMLASHPLEPYLSLLKLDGKLILIWSSTTLCNLLAPCCLRRLSPPQSSHPLPLIATIGMSALTVSLPAKKYEENRLRNKMIQDKPTTSDDSMGIPLRVEMSVIVKANVQGTIQAIIDALKTLNSAQVLVNVVHVGVGPLSQYDVDLA